MCLFVNMVMWFVIWRILGSFDEMMMMDLFVLVSCCMRW